MGRLDNDPSGNLSRDLREKLLTMNVCVFAAVEDRHCQREDTARERRILRPGSPPKYICGSSSNPGVFIARRIHSPSMKWSDLSDSSNKHRSHSRVKGFHPIRAIDSIGSQRRNNDSIHHCSSVRNHRRAASFCGTDVMASSQNRVIGL